MTTFLMNDNGRPALNQFVIVDGDEIKFKSYNTIICIIRKGLVRLNIKMWDHSRTTLKHLYIFLRQNGAKVYRKEDVLLCLLNGTFEFF